MNVQVHDSNCGRSEEHTSELQSHSEISYAVFCLKKKKKTQDTKEGPPHPARPADAGGSSSPAARLRQEERCRLFFFFNDTATTEIYTNLNTLSLHDALPI